MNELLSADWWNGISGIASILAIVAAFIAVRQWTKDRRRIMDAYPDVVVAGDWSVTQNNKKLMEGRVIRVQNIGGSGLCLHYYWTKGYKTSDEPYSHTEVEPPTSVLMPGECMTLYTTSALPENAELVLVYTTHKDAELIRYDRFDMNNLSNEAFMVSAYLNPTIRARLHRRYNGRELFTDNGISQSRRTIRFSGRLGRFNRQKKLVVNALKWLQTNGYNVYTAGEYVTARAHADDAGRPQHGE